VKLIIAIIILALSASCALADSGTGEVPRRESSRIYDTQGRYQGRVYDGRVFDSRGQFQGRIRDGKVFDARGNFKGRVKQDRPGGRDADR